MGNQLAAPLKPAVEQLPELHGVVLKETLGTLRAPALRSSNLYPESSALGTLERQPPRRLPPPKRVPERVAFVDAHSSVARRGVVRAHTLTAHNTLSPSQNKQPQAAVAS
jgi:hypothetical protein